MPSTTRSTFFTYPTKFGPVTIAADGTAVTCDFHAQTYEIAANGSH